jgi:hypothetical protein
MAGGCVRFLGAFGGPLALAACQATAAAAPPVTPVPAAVQGLAVFVEAEPAIGTVEDAEARGLATTLLTNLRDTMTAAGLSVAPSLAAASGVYVRLRIEKVATIKADAFIHGEQACGVKLEIRRGDVVLASAEPETPCVSTSTYYGISPLEAAVSLVTAASQGARLLAAAPSLRTAIPPATPAPSP